MSGEELPSTVGSAEALRDFARSSGMNPSEPTILKHECTDWPQRANLARCAEAFVRRGNVEPEMLLMLLVQCTKRKITAKICIAAQATSFHQVLVSMHPKRMDDGLNSLLGIFTIAK